MKAERTIALHLSTRDVAERAQAERSLQTEYRALITLLSHLPGMVYRSRGRAPSMEFVSEGCLRLTGYAAQDLIGNAQVSYHRDIVCAEDRERVCHELQRLLHGEFALRYRIITADGRRRWVSDRGQAVRDGSGRTLIFQGIVQDITAEVAAEAVSGVQQQQPRLAFEAIEQGWWEERLTLLAQYDALTGLPNRVLFRDRLSMAISRAKRNQALVGVVFLSLDRFARVNDTLGPAIGDRLLQEISSRLRENLREADTIGRLGGDEFTLI